MDTTHNPLKLSLAAGDMRRVHWALLAALAVVEIAVSVHFATLNPVTGWDEHIYLTSAWHLKGHAEIPYAHHRPPVFPILVALFGENYRLLPAIGHIGATAMVFLLLRRLASPAVAIAGVFWMVLAGDLRFFNLMVLTETLCAFFLLLVVLCHVSRRPLWEGAVAGLLAVFHWRTIVVLPVVLAVHAVMGDWKAVRRAIVGASLVIAPFALASTLLYGNPIYPILANARLNTVGHNIGRAVPLANDLWYYWRELPATHLALVAGVIAALVWLISNKRGTDGYGPCALVFGLVVAQLVPIHVIVSKDMRHLAPTIPLLLLLCVFMLRYYGRRRSAVQIAAWPALFLAVVAVMPDRNLRWEIADRNSSQVHQIIALRGALETVAPAEVIYTDVNYWVAMGHTGHAVVAVTGPDSSHWLLYGHPEATRSEIPDGALYMTRSPGDGDILASAPAASHGTLYLVRWRRHVVLTDQGAG